MDLSALGNLLKPYANARPGAQFPEAGDHFDQVSQHAPPEALGDGITQAFRSDQTPPFAQMLGGLYGRGNPLQRARILNQLVRSVGPALLGSLAGGRLRNAINPSAGAQPDITPEQASQVDPAEVEKAAREAEARDPSVMQSMGGVLAQHPDLVKGLGGAALAIVLGQVAQRMRH